MLLSRISTGKAADKKLTELFGKFRDIGPDVIAHAMRRRMKK